MRIPLIAATLALLSTTAFAFDVDAAKARAEGDLSKVATASMIKAIEAANAKHGSLADADIQKLDATWKSEVTAASKPTIDPMLASADSKALKALVDGSSGFYTEIFVMDSKGLNVAMSEVTSDMWQGDEAKFQKSFGANATFTDEVEMDESTQTYQTQISMPVKDASGKAIGAVTFGVAAK